MEFVLIQIINGLSWAMLLFLLTAGFTIIFGLMRIVNLAHGTYYLLGGYIGLTSFYYFKNFLLCAICGGMSIAILGFLMQRFLLHRYENEHLTQVLLTFGFVLFFSDLAFWVWGGLPETIPKPRLLEHSIRLGAIVCPSYRLALIVTGIVVAILLWWFLKSKYGILLRAGIEDEEMTSGLGVNITLLKSMSFAAGSFLAGLAGVIGGPVVGLYPGLDINILLLSLVVVITGGMGTLKGAFIGSLIVGLIDTFVKALFPTFALFTIFFLMAVILILRPTGLFGVK